MTHYIMIDNASGFVWGDCEVDDNIIIDTASGFVWGDCEADHILKACAAIDMNLGEYDRHYETASGPDFSNETGYHVYESDGTDIAQFGGGDNPEMIAAVRSMRYCGYVRITDAEDDQW